MNEIEFWKHNERYDYKASHSQYWSKWSGRRWRGEEVRVIKIIAPPLSPGVLCVLSDTPYLFLTLQVKS